LESYSKRKLIVNLITGISQTECLASILGQKPISVPETTSIHKRDAAPRLAVEEPLVVLAVARTLVLTQKANSGRSRFDANLLAIVFAVKVVTTRVAPAEPEPGAAPIGEVVVPLGFVVCAGSGLRRLNANVAGKGRAAALKERTRGWCLAVGTTTLKTKEKFYLFFITIGFC
jgi:hypothetical protein